MVPWKGDSSPMYQTVPSNFLDNPFTSTSTWLPGEICLPKSKRFLSIKDWCLKPTEEIAKSRLASSIVSRVMSSIRHSRRKFIRSNPARAILVESLGCSVSGRASNNSPLQTCVGVDFIAPKDNMLLSCIMPTRSFTRIYIFLGFSIILIPLKYFFSVISLSLSECGDEAPHVWLT